MLWTAEKQFLWALLPTRTTHISLAKMFSQCVSHLWFFSSARSWKLWLFANCLGFIPQRVYSLIPTALAAAIYTWWIGKSQEKPVWCYTQSYVQSLYSTHTINFSYHPINEKCVWLCSVLFSLELTATWWLVTKKSTQQNNLPWSPDFHAADLCFTAEINIYSWKAVPGIYPRTAWTEYLFRQHLALLRMIWDFHAIKAWYCRGKKKEKKSLTS